MNNKEQIYQELEFARRKIGRLKREVNALREALSEQALRRMRAQNLQMVQALSYVGHSPSAGDDPEHLKQVARLALLEPAYSKRGRAKRFKEARKPLAEQQWKPLVKVDGA